MKKTLKTITGNYVDVDTTDETLIGFGYKRFLKTRTLIDPDGDEVIIEGVGFGDGTYGLKHVVWFSSATDGLGFFYPNIGPDDFKEKAE